MLMDNHTSHVTLEFIELANENHIRPFPLIPHLTHVMQSSPPRAFATVNSGSGTPGSDGEVVFGTDVDTLVR
jgi:hypothetical protein